MHENNIKPKPHRYPLIAAQDASGALSLRMYFVGPSQVALSLQGGHSVDKNPNKWNCHRCLCLLAQDASGALSLRMHFVDGPTQAALSLQTGHSVAVSGVLLPGQAAPQGGQLQAEWHEVGPHAAFGCP